MNIHAGRSADGIDWEIDEQPIAFTAADPRVAEIQETFEHAYDPRVTWLEDRYYVTWCNGYHGPTIGIAYTHDFVTFHQLDNAYLPVQPQRCPVPAADRRPLPDAQPPERQRPHAVRRHLLLGEPRPDPLGPAPPRDGHAALVVGVDEDRRRPDSDRDRRGLARDLPRRPHLVQRVRLLDGGGAARSRRALARDRASERLPPLAAGRRTSRSGTCRTWSSRARRSSTRQQTGSPSTTAAPTPSSAWRTATSPSCSRSSARRARLRARRFNKVATAITGGSQEHALSWMRVHRSLQHTLSPGARPPPRSPAQGRLGGRGGGRLRRPLAARPQRRPHGRRRHDLDPGLDRRAAPSSSPRGSARRRPTAARSSARAPAPAPSRRASRPVLRQASTHTS